MSSANLNIHTSVLVTIANFVSNGGIGLKIENFRYIFPLRFLHTLNNTDKKKKDLDNLENLKKLQICVNRLSVKQPFLSTVPVFFSLTQKQIFYFIAFFG